jgi:hypothetical protein
LSEKNIIERYLKTFIVGIMRVSIESSLVGGILKREKLLKETKNLRLRNSYLKTPLRSPKKKEESNNHKNHSNANEHKFLCCCCGF